MKAKAIYAPLICYTTSELAALYNTQPRQLRKKIMLFKSELGARLGHKWNIKQVQKIFQELGWPLDIATPPNP